MLVVQLRERERECKKSERDEARFFLWGRRGDKASFFLLLLPIAAEFNLLAVSLLLCLSQLVTLFLHLLSFSEAALCESIRA
jgi:hypothetical protein